MDDLLTLFDDPTLDAMHASFWRETGHGDLQLGAVVTLARELARLAAPDQWRAVADRWWPGISRVLQAHERMDAATARRTGATLAIEIVLAAADELDARTAVGSAQALALAALQAHSNGGSAKPTAVKGNGPVPRHFRDVAHEVVRSIQRETEALVPTPFPNLNWHLIGGFRPGELVYLGGRPGTGKSSCASEFVLHVARRLQASLFVSAEMSEVAVVRRMIAQEGRLDAASLRSGRNVDHARVAASVQRMYDWPVWITAAPRTVAQIRGALAVMPTRPALLVVDYLQLLQTEGRQRERRQEIDRLSADLKRVAVEHHMPVVVLSALTRPGAGDDTKAPTMASLKESGALEADADVVLLLHRTKVTHVVDCIVAKNRDGRTGTVELRFDPTSVRFEELSHEEER